MDYREDVRSVNISAKILPVSAFKFEYIRRPSDECDIKFSRVVDRNLNSCVFVEMVNLIMVRQGLFLLERASTRVVNFWPSLTPLFWYKLVSTISNVYVHFLFLSQNVSILQFTERKFTFKKSISHLFYYNFTVGVK